jgi:hypothetical protein
VLVKAMLAQGIDPLRLGRSVLEVDTSRPVDVAKVVT